MTHVNVNSLFPRTSFVGFERLLSELENAPKRNDVKYPPHNIVKVADGQYAIEIAVAGFTLDDLTVVVEDGTLKVSGQRDEADRDYIHKGISAKKFSRSFKLADHVEVSSADLESGILTITLALVLPDSKLPREIPICGKSDPELLNEG